MTCEQWLIDVGTLCSGPARRFRRICELLQSFLLKSERGAPLTPRRISTDLSSDGSSSSYSSMDRVSPSGEDVTCVSYDRVSPSSEDVTCVSYPPRSEWI